MKASQIAVKGMYRAKVSNRIVTVRVDEIATVSRRTRNNYSGESVYGEATVYHCTNLDTGRQVTFKSAAKFRQAVGTQTAGSNPPRVASETAGEPQPANGMQLTLTRNAPTDGMATIPAGTVVRYDGHVPGGMIRVQWGNAIVRIDPRTTKELA